MKGALPVSQERALEFAGLQCQVQYGDYNEQKHKPGFLESVVVLWWFYGVFVGVLWWFCGGFVVVLWWFCVGFVVVLWGFYGGFVMIF